VVGREVVDVLPKIGLELKYPLSIQISYFRFSGRTISNKINVFSMVHSNTLSLHHSDQRIIIPILYQFPYGWKCFLSVIPPDIPTVSHPTWSGSGFKLYHREKASSFLRKVGDIYKTTRLRCGSPNS